MKKFFKKANTLKISVLSFLFMCATKVAYADDPYGISTTSGSAIASTGTNIVKEVAKVAGGVAALAGIFMAGISLILSSKNEQKRTANMSALLYIGIGCIIIGIGSALAGFFFGLGNK